MARPKISFLLAVLCTFSYLFTMAQSGDALSQYINKNLESAEIKELVKSYNLEMANNQRYLGKEGIELFFKNDKLNEIKLYNNSSVYGNFIHELPGKLKFGMSEVSIKQALGKPTLAYNSGYLEYQYPTYVLSCWFEGGKLNQVVIAAKE